ncbi:hypothetical protein PLICRDRAFT_700059 [Plicaturopsis crispa FD-325 SS-3]|nr:hypothetical protein PLICRDRAFT_700059 [Plicaturopsis crispa FD-325 SS-3]
MYQDPLASNKASSRRTTVITAVATLLVVYVFYLTGLFSLHPASPEFTATKAVAVLRGPDSAVTGTVTFAQSSKDGLVTVSGDIKNLSPNAKRGFHIHQYGDLSNACLSTGSHYNPLSAPHGAPSNPPSQRHAGDLGNVETDAQGSAVFTISTPKGVGLLELIGRAVVIHAGTDDLGQGGNEESLKTGNAGARAACGVIGLTD